MLHSMTRNATTSKTKKPFKTFWVWSDTLSPFPAKKLRRHSSQTTPHRAFRPEKPQPFSWRGSNKLLLRSNNSNRPTKNTKIVWIKKKTHFGRTNIVHGISRTCSILEPRYLMSLSLVFATFCTWESLISRYWQDFWTLNLSFCSVFATFPTLNLDFISCSILEHVQSQISYLQGTCSIPKKMPGVQLAWWLHHMRHNLLAVGMLDTKTTLHWLCEVESRYLWNILALESVLLWCCHGLLIGVGGPGLN